jgi:hypothetical protein
MFDGAISSFERALVFTLREVSGGTLRVFRGVVGFSIIPLYWAYEGLDWLVDHVED